MDIKELLDQFTLFDSAKGQRAELPAVEGNYIVVLKAGCNIPNVLGNFKYTEISLHGVDYRVLYTGIASDLKRRIWTNHLHGNGGNSTLRKLWAVCLDIRRFLVIIITKTIKKRSLVRKMKIA